MLGIRMGSTNGATGAYMHFDNVRLTYRPYRGSVMLVR